MNKVYQLVTDKIIEKLEEGCVPWRKTWSSEAPKNLVSGKEYRGINPFLLDSMGYASPYWLTFKQAKQLGGYVNKGERSTPVVFWKSWSNLEQNDEGKLEETSRFVLRYYSCFNLEQCTLPPEEVPETDPTTRHFDPIPKAQSIVEAMPSAPEITHNSQRACYSPILDIVNMPKPESFDAPAAYYSTLFHELTHSTGHESRLNREGITEANHFGSHDYSKEELTAEMGAAYLSGHCSLVDQTLDNSASYIAGWLKRLRNDPKLVVQAAGKAQRAADYILDVKWGEA